MRRVERGSPWENGYIESFNARLRDELLNGEIFYTLREAQIVIESWRRHYNTTPSALNRRGTNRPSVGSWAVGLHERGEERDGEGDADHGRGGPRARWGSPAILSPGEFALATSPHFNRRAYSRPATNQRNATRCATLRFERETLPRGFRQGKRPLRSEVAPASSTRSAPSCWSVALPFGKA